jgi:hypothetical protein
MLFYLLSALDLIIYTSSSVQIPPLREGEQMNNENWNEGRNRWGPDKRRKGRKKEGRLS